MASAAEHAVLTMDGLQQLLDALKRRFYRVLGPTVRDKAIVYDDIAALADLPRDCTDEQEGRRYRLRRRDDEAVFGFAVGPHWWKKFLHPPMQKLWTAERGDAGVHIVPEPCSRERLVTGDTKVVDRGKADGLYINTAGIGGIVAPAPIGPASVRPGDAVILSGDVGRHGIAVMAAREGLGFETTIESDCAPLAAPVLALFEAGIPVHCLRDPTRGGLASAAVEIAETAQCAIALDEAAIAMRDEVSAACELLGLDPLHVANEGRFIAFLAPLDAHRALTILHRHEVAAAAAVIGEVRDAPRCLVSCRGPFGVDRAIDMLSGEQLPRIC